VWPRVQLAGIAARYRRTWVLPRGCRHHPRYHQSRYRQEVVAATVVVAAVAEALAAVMVVFARPSPIRLSFLQ